MLGLCPRRTLVRGVLEACLPGTWVAVTGESGSGKTQLAALLARQSDRKIIWVRLGGYDARAAVTLLHQVLERLRPRREESFEEWARSALSAQTPLVLVLDDLPWFDHNAQLSQRLRILHSVASSVDLLLVSTSSRLPPVQFTTPLGKAFQPIECPPFDREEAAELLNAYGAPSDFIKPGIVTLLMATTHGNPVLLAAAARYFQQRDWRFSDAELTDLLGKQHVKPILGEILNRLMTSIADTETRDLLYRLQLVVGQFIMEDVDAVASVPPVISRAGEKLSTLAGLWIQQDSAERYRLSPLLNVLPVTNVPLPTRLDVHRTLGARIVRREVLDPFDLVRAISHFVAAAETNYAATLLIRGLQAVIEEGAIGDCEILLLIWGATPLPEALPVPVRVLVRSHQIAAYSIAEWPVAFLIDDLIRIESGLPDTESWSLVAVMAVASKVIARVNLPFLHHVLVRIVSLWHTWQLPDNGPFPPIEGIPRGALLWSSADAIRTRDDLLGWLRAVAQLDPDRQAEVFSPGFGDVCVAIVDRLFMVELDKPVAERNWDLVHKALDEVESAGCTIGQPFLRACAVRAKIVVLSECEDKLTDALALAEAKLTSLGEDAASAFLINDIAGQQSLFKGATDRAREWYEKALSLLGHATKLQQTLALLNASHAFAGVDEQVAVRHAEHAAEVAKTLEHPVPMRAQACGELAVARWFAGDSAGAYYALDEALEALFATHDRNDSWKGLFVLLGHACAYYARIARSQPPPFAAGGDVIVAPRRGHFLSQSLYEMSRLFSERQSLGVFCQLAMFADGAGIDEGLRKWAEKGLQAARTAGIPGIVALYSGLCLVPELLKGNLRAAVNLSFENARIQTARHHASDHAPVWAERDMEPALDLQSESVRGDAEHSAVTLVVLPVVFDMARKVGDGHAVDVDLDQLLGAMTNHASTEASRTLLSEVATMLRLAFITRPGAGEVLAAGERSAEWIVKIIAQLGCSMDVNVPLATAYSAQINALMSSEQLWDGVLGLERNLILPFIESFWTSAFDAQRFRFSSPALVATRLREARDLRTRARLRTTLQIVADGLGLRVPEHVRLWLRTKGDDDLLNGAAMTNC